MKHESVNFWRHGLLVWLAVIGAEFVHGILRGLLLEPLTGDFRARQITVFTGIAIFFSIAYGLRRGFGDAGRRRLLALGAVWVGLTIAFEITLGRLLGLSWERIFSDYDLPRGGLMPFGLAALALAPLAAVEYGRRTTARRVRTA